MSTDAAESSTRLEIDWLKAIAGALAAVASAVLLSTLGAAGTILGAAIGSLVITVGSALFSQGLDRSKRGLTRAQEKAQKRARRRLGVAEAEVSRAVRAEDTAAREAHLEHAGEQLAQANQELEAPLTGAEAGVGAGADPVMEPDGVPVGWRARLASLPWKHIGLVSLGLFVAAIVTITVFELLAGRSVASITGGSSGDGGTTIGNVGGGSNKEKEDRPRDGSSESPSPSESESPTGEPSQTTHTPTPSATVTDTPSEAGTPSHTAVPPEPQDELPDPAVGETDGASP